MIAAFAMGACSDDTPDEGPDISVPDDTGTNNGTSPDAGDVGDAKGSDAQDSGDISDPSDAGDAGDATPDGDAGPECPQTACVEGEVCVEGQCLDETPANKCAAAQDLGALSPGSPITISDTTDGATDLLATECAADAGNELVYKFTVTEDSLITFEAEFPAQFDATIEFRMDNCTSPAAGSACFDANSDISVSAGTTVYLVVEQYVGRGNAFSLTLQAEAQACTPGDATCTADTLEVCSGNEQPFTYACGASCAAGADQCEGTICANAIPVSGSASFAGDLEAYATNFDFGANDDCTFDGSPVPTPGAEVIFKLEGLDAGQIVSIATGPNRAMFFTTSCQATPVCEDVLLSQGTTGSVDWTVPAGFSDQDVYLIIDRRTQTPGAFTYDIDISTP
jgi:hypothetical protein